MLEGKASATAVLVAFARALASHDVELSGACDDKLAVALLPRPLARLLVREDGGLRSASARHVLRRAVLGMAEHLALRTALIDEAVTDASAKGIDQLVLLGAGLDTRAHRLAALRDTVVFEVDHPDTQQLKRKRIQGHAPLAREVRYSACDFGDVTLDEALDAQGFERGRPSMWVWEGVTMYLPAVAVHATLDAVAAYSAPGSRALISYVTPALGHRGSALNRVGVVGLRALGEPLKGTFEPAELADAVARRGFRTVSDRLPLEEAPRFGIDTRRAILVPMERLLLADRLESS